jgi:tRNA nucleotidyltransferase (CCA-adding enzyme)
MSDKINRVIKTVYKSFVPNEKDHKRVAKTAEGIKTFILRKAKESNIQVSVDFAGSYAKNTWIKNESDVDIFVSFNSEKATLALSKLVPKGFSPERGTRTYFRGKVGGIEIEIVPLVKLKDLRNTENSIDLSILHADYIKTKLNKNLRTDVIMLKQFCKVNGCYGSETYRHGFSGYSLELLIIKYGGLRSLFNSVTTWMPGVYIDIENAYKDEAAALEVFGAHESPILLVDPTNPKRNVCGSLNVQNFSGFVFSVKKFLISPSREFFIKKDEETALINLSKSRGTRLFRYKTEIAGPKDRFLSKYNKNLLKLLRTLDETGISIYDYKPLYRENSVQLFLQIENVPKTKTRKVFGPNVWLDFKHFKAFLKAHKDAYVVGEFVVYDKEYKVGNFNGFIRDKFKEFISTKAIIKN